MRKLNIGWILLALLTLPVAAAANDTVAEVSNQGEALVFDPIVPFKEMVLTVTGPCNFEFRQRITKGQLVFQLDSTTIDGVYRYRLAVNPELDPGIIDILKDARNTGDQSQVDQLCRDGKLPTRALDQSQGFLVVDGRIVLDPGAIEKDFELTRKAADAGGDALMTPMAASDVADGSGAPIRAKDFVINDDLIVDGSACIGFDCVNGEVFSFDTIRLKENNLRIKFDDTSTVPSFPANDWQLTANESANGGASKFSIEDVTGGRTPFTVEANARSHSLYVDDGGRIGSRTSTPSVEIHTIDGDTPTLRLQQDGSSGFEPQTWDVAGNETNFFVRDVTNGSTLPLRIRPGAPSSSVFIDVDGDVGINNSSPTERLHIRDTSGGANPGFQIESGTNAWVTRAHSSGEYRVSVNGSGVTELRLDASGNLIITGSVTTGGPTCGMGCDRVFSSDYDLPSIEEHASEMWSNNFLPAVGPTPEDGSPFNVTEKVAGMLNELEKAHIYIEQLHAVIQELNQRVEKLESE